MPTHVAIAILHQHDHFLMQLRDDDPAIAYPGHWGFFGGHVEPDEEPDAAVRRELIEEIGYAPSQLTRFRRYETEQVVRHVYEGALAVSPGALNLQEGMDLKLISLEDVRRGSSYSRQVQEMRPLGTPHRTILLEFWDDWINQLSVSTRER